MDTLSPPSLPSFTDVDAIERLAAFFGRHQRILVLTGAGISTASGIPDYRDADGERRGKQPIQGPEFRKLDAVRRRYWARSMAGYPVLARAAPNAGHAALAALQAQGRIGSLMTQNVDGLHGRAGSSGVLELHGNIHAVVCMDCHAGFTRAFVQELLVEANPALARALAKTLAGALTGAVAETLTGAPPGAANAAIRAAPDGDAHVEPDALDQFNVPNCVHCGGTLKPDVVFFGDGVAPAINREALARMDQADALLVIGSSLMVYSGFRFCRIAAASGKPIAAINLGKTRADELISLKVAASAESALPILLRQLA